MTRWIEVRRIDVPTFGPFNYPAVKAEVDAAIARGDEVHAEGEQIVIRQLVDLRGRGRAA